MFGLAKPSYWLDWLRVPTDVSAAPEGTALWMSNGRTLSWEPARGDGPLKRYSLVGVPVFSRCLRTAPPAGEAWEPIAALSEDQKDCAFVWRSDTGIFLPFDPDESILALLSEAYVKAEAGGMATRAKAVARKTYYRARPLLPRSAQLAARRAFSRVQSRQRFPRWPLESSLHDLCELLLSFAAEVAGEPVPWIAPWPKPYSWALVLTHDVETGAGYENIDRICAVERRHGFRSSWNLVPKRDYIVDDGQVTELQRAGWEVGVHGLHHDGRDLESERVLTHRRPQMREWAERWKATGFRSPATQRDWSLMPSLGFDYDSSYPDTDPFEPQGGGCCAWLPFFNDELVELPITLPQDHTLFVILGEKDAQTWLRKADVLRERGGMVLIDTHPDYLSDEPAGSAYTEFLAYYSDDPEMWRALPAEVTSWWRRRAATSIEREPGSWRLVGAASDDAALRYASPQAAYR